VFDFVCLLTGIQ